METPVIISIAAFALGVVALLWRMHISTIKRIDKVCHLLSGKYDLLSKKYDFLIEKIDVMNLEMNKKIDAQGLGTNKKIDAQALETNKKIDAQALETNKKIDAQALETNRRIDAIYRLLDSLKDLILAMNGRLSRIEGVLSNRPWEVNSLGGSASFPVTQGQRSMETSRT